MSVENIFIKKTQLDLTEFEKLVEMCEKAELYFIVADMYEELCNGRQIVIFKDPKAKKRVCDAVIHFGSYGSKQGLLEFANANCKEVVGFLNAEECFKLFEKELLNA